MRSLLAAESVSTTLVPQIQKIIDTVLTKKVEELTSLEKSLFFRATAIIGGWTDTLKPGSNISYEDFEKNPRVMTQGGPILGKRTCNLRSREEFSLVAQALDWYRLIQESEVNKKDLSYFLNFLLKLASNVRPTKATNSMKVSLDKSGSVSSIRETFEAISSSYPQSST